MSRRLFPMIALALLAASPAPLAAAARPGPNRPLQKAIAELGLTPAQRRQLMQLRRARRPEQIQVTRQIRARRQELAALYGTYPLDEAKAAVLIQQIAQLESQRLRLQLQHQVELRRILTREQFVQFTRIMESQPRPAAQGPPARE